MTKPFKLKSGNTTPFKEMGSCPADHEEYIVGGSPLQQKLKCANFKQDFSILPNLRRDITLKAQDIGQGIGDFRRSVGRGISNTASSIRDWRDDRRVARRQKKEGIPSYFADKTQKTESIQLSTSAVCEPNFAQLVLRFYMVLIYASTIRKK